MDRNKAVFVCPVVPAESLPSRGAWIEITAQDVSDLEYQSSLPTRGAWIEITRVYLRSRLICAKWRK